MNSALIIRGGAIGDFILTLPSIHAFRDFYPKTRVEILGYPHIAELARKRFYAESIRSMDHRSVAGFFATKGELDPNLSQYVSSFDLVVTFLYDPDTVFQNNLKRAGVRKLAVADGRPSEQIHASEHLSSWLSQVGVPIQIRPPRIYPSDQDQIEARNILGENQPPIVALHLGSGSTSKNWPMACFLELTEWLKSEGIKVLVIDGPADSENREVFWKNPLSKDCIYCHHLALPTLAAVLQKCLAFVGHDSGISHLCAAVGTPTIAIFGPTDPTRWAPRGTNVSVLQKGNKTSSVTLNDIQMVLKKYLSKNLQ